tara:strand:+ start:162 stop:668 length:507 start_codon:yes stop_codon:yes gene_type:complete
MFKVPFKRSFIEKRLNKNYQKINYNKFRWWRWYQDRNTPLPTKADFRDKIFNGDFDPSCYQLQAWLCEHMLNDMEIESPDGELDHSRSDVQLMKARRKRLLEDYEKDEEGKIESLWNHFTKHFDIDKKEVIQEALECRGEIIDLYYIIEDKYRKQFKVSRRGRPKKYD